MLPCGVRLLLLTALMMVAGCGAAARDLRSPDTADVSELDNAIVDVIDRCPHDAEDANGFLDQDGCPDTDNDSDGVADAVDQCLEAEEDYNGTEDDDGCPDSGPVCLSIGYHLALEPILFATGLTYAGGALARLESTAEALHRAEAVQLVAITAYATSASERTRAEARAERVRGVLLAHQVGMDRLIVQVLDRSASSQPNAADRVDLIVLREGVTTYTRSPDGTSYGGACTRTFSP